MLGGAPEIKKSNKNQFCHYPGARALLQNFLECGAKIISRAPQNLSYSKVLAGVRLKSDRNFIPSHPTFLSFQVMIFYTYPTGNKSGYS